MIWLVSRDLNGFCFDYFAAVVVQVFPGWGACNSAPAAESGELKEVRASVGSQPESAVALIVEYYGLSVTT